VPTIDRVYPEWNRKAAGFVSYGSAMGARGVQQLRETVIELQLAPSATGVSDQTARHVRYAATERRCRR